MIVRAAWLYTRSKDSVRMEVREEPGRFLLMVYGPGEHSHHEVSTTYSEAMRAQGTFEEQFLARGFVLEGFDQPCAPRPVRTRRAKSANPLSLEDPAIPRGADSKNVP